MFCGVIFKLFKKTVLKSTKLIFVFRVSFNSHPTQPQYLSSSIIHIEYTVVLGFDQLPISNGVKSTKGAVCLLLSIE